MTPIPPVIGKLPLEGLWDESGVLPLRRQRYLNREEITSRLRLGSIRFVVADVGKPLRWIPPGENYRFWKSEVKPRLPETDRFRLEDFPGGYCYLASEWTGPDEIVVLLEAHH